jgi:hypothetical protein
MILPEFKLFAAVKRDILPPLSGIAKRRQVKFNNCDNISISNCSI